MNASNLLPAAALATLLSFGGAALWAQDQPSEDATAAAERVKEQKVRELLALTGGSRMGHELLTQMVDQLGAREDVPPGFVDALKRLAKPEELVESIVPIYMRHFDDEALDGAIAFYQSPVGRRVAAVQRRVQLESMEAGQTWGQELVVEALEELQPGGLAGADREINEAVAIGALKTIHSAQMLFRKGDKDQNGVLEDAADLSALARADLIDPKLASGKRNGYRFRLCRGTEAPEFLWMAVASPEGEGRHFAINHLGVVHESDVAFQVDEAKCEITSGKPLGR